MDISRSIEMPSSATRVSYKARLFTGLFLVAAGAFAMLYFLNSLWTPSVDVAAHYALTARLSEQWQLPVGHDPSLGNLTMHPRSSYRVAALFGKLLGSPMIGMHFTALLSLVAVWAGLAMILFSLPRRVLWMVFGLFAALLLLNRLMIHAELFGTELVGNYFYPQVVAQGSAMLVIALALWLERSDVPWVIGYLILGASVPMIEQFHLLPALEVLAVSSLLVVLDFLSHRKPRRGLMLGVGMGIVILSLIITLTNSAFTGMMRIAENNGLLVLRYTPTLTSVVVESLIVIGLSARLLWQWLRLERGKTRSNAIAIKYLGVFGLGAAGLCLLQIVALRFGFGSEYACKKYAFTMNTITLLDAALLPALLVPRWRDYLTGLGDESPSRWQPLVQQALPGLLLIIAFLTIFPSPSARFIALSDVVAGERFAQAHAAPVAGGNSGKYDYAIGMFPNSTFDYLVTTGILRSPKTDNAADLLNGQSLSQPAKIDRIFSRAGSGSWDVSACRQLTTPDGFVILDGQCVLRSKGILPPKP